MTISIKEQAQQLLEQLPPEGLKELAWFIEFLQFKYRLATVSEPAASPPTEPDIPAGSLTARCRGFIQSPLSVAELAAVYETSMMGDDERFYEL